MQEFYQNSDSELRFGDVLKIENLLLTSPELLKDPNSESLLLSNITLTQPIYFVILTPCCSIGNRMISLAPLTELDKQLFKNKGFREDMLFFNRKIQPEESVPDGVWEKLDEPEKQKRKNEGIGYAFVDKFIYSDNDLLPQYSIEVNGSNVTTTKRMVDFRETSKISCKHINSPSEAPRYVKLLQLSIASRKALRDKLGYYYLRVPVEDRSEE